MRQADVWNFDMSQPHCLPAVIVAGPTCSGKSDMALMLARALGGTIINADSMQVYKELRVLTARPTEADEASVPHRLYGILPASQTGSVAWWRERALESMNEAWQSGRLPILCGGTGMYMNALVKGLAEIPASNPSVRDETREFVKEHGPAALHARLMEADPEMAQRLQPADSQRVSRAWEVLHSTGRSLTWWQMQPGLPPAACRFVALRILPPRDELRARIALRFERMMSMGALNEAELLLSQKLDSSLPAMRAHGVPELIAYLRGEISEEEAIRLAVLATGRYTRRQATWFAHHALTEEGGTYDFNSCTPSFEKFLKRKQDEIISFIINRIDASC